jgi:hypothetical protein
VQAQTPFAAAKIERYGSVSRWERQDQNALPLSTSAARASVSSGRIGLAAPFCLRAWWFRMQLSPVTAAAHAKF